MTLISNCICLFIISRTLVYRFASSLSVYPCSFTRSPFKDGSWDTQIAVAWEPISILIRNKRSPVGQIIGLDVLRPGELAEYDLILALDYLLLIDIVLPQQTQRIRHDRDLNWCVSCCIPTVWAHAQYVKARSHETGCLLRAQLSRLRVRFGTFQF